MTVDIFSTLLLNYNYSVLHVLILVLLLSCSFPSLCLMYSSYLNPFSIHFQYLLLDVQSHLILSVDIRCFQFLTAISRLPYSKSNSMLILTAISRLPYSKSISLLILTAISRLPYSKSSSLLILTAISRLPYSKSS